MVYDGLEMNYRTVRIRKDPNCAVCGDHPTVTELIDYDDFCGAISTEAAEAAKDSTISVKDLAAMLDQRERASATSCSSTYASRASGTWCASTARS